jgi:hypothetical protein
MSDVTIDIGISQDDRAEITDGLSHLLADTYTLYLKTHNYHWNVTGPMFQTLHLMFETQYNELAWRSTSSPSGSGRSASLPPAPTGSSRRSPPSRRTTVSLRRRR